jgi:hypothetical protein
VAALDDGNWVEVLVSLDEVEVKDGNLLEVDDGTLKVEDDVRLSPAAVNESESSDVKVNVSDVAGSLRRVVVRVRDVDVNFSVKVDVSTPPGPKHV